MTSVQNHIKYCYHNNIKNIILTFDMLSTMKLDDIIAMLYLTTYYDSIIDFSDIHKKDLECARTCEYWILNDHKNMNEVILFYTLCMSYQLENTLYPPEEDYGERIDPLGWYILFADEEKNLKLSDEFINKIRLLVLVDNIDPLICSKLFAYLGNQDTSYITRYSN